MPSGAEARRRAAKDPDVQLFRRELRKYRAREARRAKQELRKIRFNASPRSRFGGDTMTRRYDIDYVPPGGRSADWWEG